MRRWAGNPGSGSVTRHRETEGRLGSGSLMTAGRSVWLAEAWSAEKRDLFAILDHPQIAERNLGMGESFRIEFQAQDTGLAQRLAPACDSARG